MEKVAPGFTGFIPAVVVASISLNWSSLVAPACLAPLEDSIGEGILVIALGFC